MTKNQNHDAASSIKRIKTCNNSTGVVPWSDLNHDLLLLAMMQLGVVEFLAFSGVCKQWRSLAVANKNKFMASRAPMTICISTNANEKEFYLGDFEGRKFKTTVPHSADRRCTGVTCGYLILFCKKNRDFWLVNPITRHELYFPALPVDKLYDHTSCREILFFSPLIHEWVLVVFSRLYYETIWFFIEGKGEWTRVASPLCTHDLVVFKGKIYAIDETSSTLCEVEIYPTPIATLLEIKNFLISDMYYPVLVSWGEYLLVMDRFAEHPLKIKEINFSKMECLSHEKIGEEYAFFVSTSISVPAALRALLWADVHSQNRRFDVPDKRGKDRLCANMRYFFNEKNRLFYGKIWYFFHDCLNANILH